jgi:hypothetical protein
VVNWLEFGREMLAAVDGEGQGADLAWRGEEPGWYATHCERRP